MSEEVLRRELRDFIIDRSRPEFADCPETVEGQVLLERVYDVHGVFAGWLTVSVEDLAKVIKERDDPLLRPDAEVIFNGAKRKLRGLTKDEYEEFTGYGKYLKMWRGRGIVI